MSTDRITDDMWHSGQHGMTRAMLHAEGTRARAAEEAKDAEIARLRAALRPFAEFARKFDARPIRGLDDALYSIHGGAGAPSGIGADLRLSDCRAALKALEGT